MIRFINKSFFKRGDIGRTAMWVADAYKIYTAAQNKSSGFVEYVLRLRFGENDSSVISDFYKYFDDFWNDYHDHYAAEKSEVVAGITLLEITKKILEFENKMPKKKADYIDAVNAIDEVFIREGVYRGNVEEHIVKLRDV